MQNPTKGRVLFLKYDPTIGMNDRPGWEEENPGTVVRVTETSFILSALCVYPGNGASELVTVEVPLDEGVPSPGGFSWRWPPKVW